MRENFNFKGIIDINIYNGNMLEENYIFENLITNDGYSYFKDLIAGNNVGGINGLALGSGTTEATPEDTKLEERLLLLEPRVDMSLDNGVKFLVTVPENTFDSMVAYQEAGLVYRTLYGETLITRAVFDVPIYQRPENTMSISYTLTLG